MDDKKIAASDVDGGADSLEIETLSPDEAKRLQETVRTAYRPAFEALKDK